MCVCVRARACLRVCARVLVCVRARAVTEHEVQQNSTESMTTKPACSRVDYRNQCTCSEKFLFANLVWKFLKIFIWQVDILSAVPSSNHQMSNVRIAAGVQQIRRL